MSRDHLFNFNFYPVACLVLAHKFGDPEETLADEFDVNLIQGLLEVLDWVV
jgi:hypothetical protein